jgi:hypothetical protein
MGAYPCGLATNRLSGMPRRAASPLARLSDTTIPPRAVRTLQRVTFSWIHQYDASFHEVAAAPGSRAF